MSLDQLADDAKVECGSWRCLPFMTTFLYVRLHLQKAYEKNSFVVEFEIYI